MIINSDFKRLGHSVSIAVLSIVLTLSSVPWIAHQPSANRGAGGPPRQLSSWTSEQIFSFGWSRDGKRVMISRGSRQDDIVLIRDAR